ncbi:MAG: bestrophin family ion channel [Alphaproteobacteria bacterium]|nr:bestrophin family ion channel [Alphaproteobacteria bacterium]
MIVNTNIPFSYFFNKIKYDILCVLVVTIFLNIITGVFHEKIPIIPITVPAFIGTSISILLSFKINQSYERWWEARKIWGSIVNDSRSLVIQIQSFIPDDKDEFVQKIALRQIAWCYSLGQQLRGLNASENLKEYISFQEQQFIEGHDNKPLALLQCHAQDIKILKNTHKIDTYSHIQLDSTLVRLCDAAGRAERIKSTVFPITYRIFLHFAIYLFLITLSIALLGVKLQYEIILLLSISSVFFLLEKSAIRLQDPFENRQSDTSVTAIARKIEINIKQLIQNPHVPKPLQPETYFLK